MTDIREQAAKAAREKLGVPPSDDEAYPCQTCERDTFIHAYLLGHAAGVADGARAFADWLEKCARPSVITVRVCGDEGGHAYNRAVSITDAATDFLASRKEHG